MHHDRHSRSLHHVTQLNWSCRIWDLRYPLWQGRCHRPWEESTFMTFSNQALNVTLCHVLVQKIFQNQRIRLTYSFDTVNKVSSNFSWMPNFFLITSNISVLTDQTTLQLCTLLLRGAQTEWTSSKSSSIHVLITYPTQRNKQKYTIYRSVNFLWKGPAWTILFILKLQLRKSLATVNLLICSVEFTGKKITEGVRYSSWKW